MLVFTWVLATFMCGLAIFALTVLLAAAKDEKGSRLGGTCLAVLLVTSMARCYCEIKGFSRFAGDVPTSTGGVIAFMLTTGLTAILLALGAALYVVATELKHILNKYTLYAAGIGLLLAWVSLFANTLNFSYTTGPAASATLNTISITGGTAALVIMTVLKVRAKIRRTKAAKA